MTNFPQIGPIVRRLRGEWGWSQQVLARKSFIRQRTISDIECGKTTPTLDTLLHLSEALKVPVLALLIVDRS